MVELSLCKLQALKMLYKVKAEQHPLWIYYVEKVIDLEQEIFVFKSNGTLLNATFLEKGEHYFLHLCSPNYIFQSRIDENGILVVNRFDSSPNWKIYLWGKELVAISRKNRLEPQT